MGFIEKESISERDRKSEVGKKSPISSRGYPHLFFIHFSISPAFCNANERNMPYSSGFLSKSFLHVLVKFWCSLLWYTTVAHEHSNKYCTTAGKVDLKRNTPDSHMTSAEVLYPKRLNEPSFKQSPQAESWKYLQCSLWLNIKADFQNSTEATPVLEAQRRQLCWQCLQLRLGVQLEPSLWWSVTFTFPTYSIAL